MTTSPTRLTAAIISVGDEIVSGRVLDQHAAYASGRLGAAGVETRLHVTVSDRVGELSTQLRAVASTVDIVVITGGIGPTEDDRTRSEVAIAADVDLEYRDDSWERIRARFGDRLRSEERNKRQAFFPVGAEEIENPLGTAPAFHVPGHHPGVVSSLGWWVFPGVPREFRGLFESNVIPSLPATTRANRDVMRVFGISESVLDAWILRTLPAAYHSDYHVCVTDGEIEIHAPVGLELGAKLASEYGDRFLGSGHDDLARRVISAGISSQARLATAESCTGGGIAARMTDVAGASGCFEMGWITYTNHSKVAQLGVDPEILERYGAVSAETVEAMARGAAERSGATHVAAVSGVAGPDGGSPEKPVGTVFLAILSPIDLEVQRLELPGDRGRVRTLTVQNALFGLLRALRS